MSSPLSYFPFQRGPATQALLVVCAAWLLALLWRGQSLPDMVNLGFTADSLLELPRWLWQLAFGVISALLAVPFVIGALVFPRLRGDKSIRFPGAQYWLQPQRRQALLAGLAALFNWTAALQLAGAIAVFETVASAQGAAPPLLNLGAFVLSLLLMLVLPHVLLIWAVLKLRRPTQAVS